MQPHRRVAAPSPTELKPILVHRGASSLLASPRSSKRRAASELDESGQRSPAATARPFAHRSSHQRDDQLTVALGVEEQSYGGVRAQASGRGRRRRVRHHRSCPTAAASGGPDRVESWLLACERGSARSTADIAASPGGAGGCGSSSACSSNSSDPTISDVRIRPSAARALSVSSSESLLPQCSPSWTTKAGSAGSCTQWFRRPLTERSPITSPSVRERERGRSVLLGASISATARVHTPSPRTSTRSGWW